MEITITSASRLDAINILRLQQLCYQSEANIYGDFSIPPLTQTLNSLLEEFVSHRILIARKGPDIIGSVRACETGTGCHIGKLIVHPQQQRQGIGSGLMRRIEKEFANARRYELFTGHLSEGNLRLYHRLGYQEFKRKNITPNLIMVYLEKLTSNG
jgi:ribosomal protein S18 acetylase RimI-like enzyme